MIYLKGKQLRDTKVRTFDITGLAAPVRRELPIRFLFVRQHIIKKVARITLGFLVALLFFGNAWAAFGISAIPYEGGSDLRFGRLGAEISEVKKEVTIRVTTDINKQYRVFQEINSPLTNSEGQVIPYTSLTFYTLRGSNRRGSLDAEQQQSMRRGRTLLYTSDTQGQGDSFILVYSLSSAGGLLGGDYRGQIRFSLESVDGSATPQQVYLNVRATLEPSASLEVITPVGGKTIELKAGEVHQEKNEVLIRIKGNFGQTYRIMQSLFDNLRSDERELPAGSVFFKVSEGRKGVVAGQGELRPGNTVLYTSSPRGEADDVLVTYHLTEPLEAKAGTYRGRVRFPIEGPASLTRVEQTSLNFLVKIEPTFELEVSPETGGRIEFRDLKSGQPPKVNEVVIEVETNLGKPYQVSQKVENLLTNKEGKAIPKDKFVFYEQALTQAGVLKQASRAPVEVGETTLYVSDEKGAPAKFKIIYELTIPRDLTAGSYSSQITYSISEL